MSQILLRMILLLIFVIFFKVVGSNTNSVSNKKSVVYRVNQNSWQVCHDISDFIATCQVVNLSHGHLVT